MVNEINAFTYKKEFNLLKINKINYSHFYCEKILSKRIGYSSLKEVMEVILQKVDIKDVPDDNYQIIKIISFASWFCLDNYQEAIFNFLEKADDTTIKIKILKKTE